MERIDPRVAEEVRRLGGFDLEKCYNCGSCSAVCPLAEGEAAFPRRMIRYTLLGLEQKILAAPEPWLCYYCGECSSTCPREANPSGLMMALRRFTIRRYSIGRVADLFYSAFASGVAWLILTAIAFAAIVIFHNPAMDMTKVDFLSFISLGDIHAAGVAIVVFIVLAFLANVWIMFRSMKRGSYGAAISMKSVKASSLSAIREAAFQRRFGECEDNRYRRIAHLGISWGFVGMFVATAIIGAIDFKWVALPRWVSLAVGSIAGFAALLGLGYFYYLRFTRGSEYSKRSHQSDWSFVVLLTLSIMSGYVMVAFRFLHMPSAAYGTFAFHLVVVFNFLVSLPFTKFAHAVYRPLALWLAGVK